MSCAPKKPEHPSAPQTPPGRLHRWFRIVGWNMAIFLAGAIFIELVFGSWFTAPKLWSLSISRDVDMRIAVNAIYKRATPIRYTRGPYGLRGNFGAPKHVNIVTIGGSTTDEGMVSNEETWSAVMQSCLNKVGVPAVVANAGVGGQSSYGHAMNFRLWLNHIPDFSPKFAVILLGFNERYFEPDRPLENPHAHMGQESEPERATTKKLIRWMKIQSAFYGLYRIIKGNWIAWQARINPAWEQKVYNRSAPTKTTAADRIDLAFKGESNNRLTLDGPEHISLRTAHDAKLASKLTAYGDRLLDLAKAAREFKTTPVFVTQSAGKYRRSQDGQIIGSVSSFLVMGAFNGVTRTFCQKTKAQCIDLADRLSFGDGDLYDDIHTTPQGSRRIGDEICRQLIPKLNGNLR